MASSSGRSLSFDRMLFASSTQPTWMSPWFGLRMLLRMPDFGRHLQRGDSGIVKMHAISMIEKAIGMASGILQDAETFAPLICDAPRLIHDSRVYPKLCGVSITAKPKKSMKISRHKQTVKHDMLGIHSRV